MNSLRWIIFATLICGLPPGASFAQQGGFSGMAPREAAPPPPVPAGMQDVGVDEKLDAQLPLDLVFTNEAGKQVTLRDCLIPGKPAILQLEYFGCPMLCDLVSQGMLKSMQELDLNIGDDFSVIHISFDPRETFSDGYKKKKTYINRYERSGAAGGWHFLVGKKDSIVAMTAAVGFKYKWIAQEEQFSHPAVLMVLSPQGRVSRYLYGVEFPKQTLRLSLVEASEGKVGNTIDKVMMLCFRYDAAQGKYTFTAVVLMRLAGVLTVVVLASAIVHQLVKERRARRDAPAGPAT
jgi:protein SCO1/2